MLKNRILSLDPNDIWSLRFTKAEKQTLLAMAQSRKAVERKRCAEWFNVGIRKPQNLPFLLELAALLIPDRSIRWDVLCSLTEFTETHPEKLWPLIVKWGSVPSTDIREGIACCLLEHVLEHHFDPYFARVQQLIEGGNRRFADTLSICYRLGQSEEPGNADRWDRLAASLHAHPGTKK